ncbi:prolyl aminopeptidase [Synchytrium microbalum]|uniref:Proline iminopeptidase n=1 Tax=Synchytrium microbalum TaxID=1806994 RepID=A0A507C7C9_9FUNG|nr:prolyl aminopeptidase [Synchytrium microbalum]TPX35238.1 prolyl aminopeptidase [Synchytrium microbalum]
MSFLLPPVEPYKEHFIPVTSIHTLYICECGNPNGKPVVFLHGGPGGGVSSDDRRYFDQSVYRIILFDQRGAGKSTPAAELDDNTTFALIDDIERIRVLCNVDSWVVFGGSWGSTLALTYAIKHPTRVKALILRGIFTLRRKELLWFYQEGASYLFPDAWEEYLEPIPFEERGDMIAAYYKRLTGSDENEQLKCAKAWAGWEVKTSRLQVDPDLVKKVDSDVWSLQFARIECSYFFHAGWFESDEWILENIDLIRHIPGVIVQGRYDVVCPAFTAWDLHKQWPEAEFHLIPDAGHSAKEPGIQKKLVEAAQKFSTL